MMIKPEISVIMLTYNREKIVPHMIECIQAQTFENFEFIIVDNGSQDGSGAVADKYAEGDPRIRVIHKGKGNIGSGRNAGLDAATGEYIAFVDDDDDCDPDFLEYMLTLAKKHGADISICNAHGKTATAEETVMNAEESVIMLLWRKKYNVQFPTKLIKRSLMNEFRFSETDNYDDIGLAPQVLAAAKTVVFGGSPKYTFNRHDNNNSAWTTNHELITPEILTEYLRIYKERTAMLSEKFPENAAYWRYFRYSFMISMLEKITRLSLTESYAIRDDLKKELLAAKDEFAECPWILDFEREWVQTYL
ncbi:MAG: glycosyltransferase [Ruminococcus sp.]|nr:glycosyltransferase [Ruminococcus sp.]